MNDVPPIFFAADSRSSLAAFTLVELLAVIAIMATMMALVTPAITGLKGASDINTATADISGILEQARAYAMANNTFVYVGFQEVNVSNSENVAPQSAGTGRIAAVVVASKDGTRSSSSTLSSAAVVPISKLQRFENIHFGTAGTSGNMARPSVDAIHQIGSSTFDSTISFSWPLTGTAKYNLNKVIEFDPQGVPRPAKESTDVVIPRMEIDLEQTKGNAIPANAPESAILLDGITGATSIYRP